MKHFPSLCLPRDPELELAARQASENFEIAGVGAVIFRESLCDWAEIWWTQSPYSNNGGSNAFPE